MARCSKSIPKLWHKLQVVMLSLWPVNKNYQPPAVLNTNLSEHMSLHPTSNPHCSQHKLGNSLCSMAIRSFIIACHDLTSFFTSQNNNTFLSRIVSARLTLPWTDKRSFVFNLLMQRFGLCPSVCYFCSHTLAMDSCTLPSPHAAPALSPLSLTRVTCEPHMSGGLQQIHNNDWTRQPIPCSFICHCTIKSKHSTATLQRVTIMYTKPSPNLCHILNNPTAVNSCDI